MSREREQMRRVARGYEAMISGCVRDLGVTREVAAAIASRAQRWAGTCDVCGKPYPTKPCPCEEAHDGPGGAA